MKAFLRSVNFEKMNHDDVEVSGQCLELLRRSVLAAQVSDCCVLFCIVFHMIRSQYLTVTFMYMSMMNMCKEICRLKISGELLF